MPQENVLPGHLLGQMDFGPYILLNDDFNGNISWANQWNAGSSIALDTSILFSGSKSLKMTSASNTIETVCGGQHDILLRPLGLIYINYLFFVDPDSNNWSIYFILTRYDGTTENSFQINYDRSSNEWSFTPSGGGSTIITDLPTITANRWNALTLSLNLENHTYENLILNENIHNFSSALGPQSASALPRQAFIQFGGYKQATAGPEQLILYLDNFSIFRG